MKSKNITKIFFLKLIQSMVAVYFSLIACNTTHAKDFEIEKVNIVYNNNLLNNATIHFYKPLYKIKYGEYKNYEEVDRSTPENAMKSFFSANTKKWFLSNISDSDLDLFNDLDDTSYNDTLKPPYLYSDTVYINLILKFRYSDLENHYCLVRFNDNYPGEKNDSNITYLFKKNKNEWIFISYNGDNEQDALHSFLNYFKVEVIKALIIGKSEDPKIIDLINKTRSEKGYLDLNKLNNIFLNANKDTMQYFCNINE